MAFTADASGRGTTAIAAALKMEIKPLYIIPKHPLKRFLSQC